MKKQGFTPQYIICVILVLFAALAFCFIRLMNVYIAQMDAKGSQLASQEKRYNPKAYPQQGYPGLELVAKDLRESQTRLNIQPVSKDNATQVILRYADFLREKYGAAITSAAVDTDTAITVTMSLVYEPKNPEEFFFMLNTVFKEEFPMVYISALNIELTDALRNLYTVKAVLELAKPYKKGMIDEEK